MHDKRLTNRLITYWDSLRKEKPLPEYVKFNNAAVEDIREHCMVLALQPGNASSYKIEFMGNNIVEAYGKDETGHYASSNLKGIPGASILKSADKVTAENPTPLDDQGQFINNKNKIVKYRSCLVPFGTESRISHIVVGISWKTFG